MVYFLKSIFSLLYKATTAVLWALAKRKYADKITETRKEKLENIYYYISSITIVSLWSFVKDFI